MSYNSRNYRHRNPKTGDEQKTSTPFFSSPSGTAAQKKNGSAVQRKKGSGFFQSKLTVGQPGDVYEKEADSVASQVVNRQNGQKPALQEKESGTVRRLATSKEDEKLGTHDARMEKDKEEPMKPVQKKLGPGAGGEKKPGDEKKKEKGVHKMDDPKKKKELHKADDPKKKKKELQKAEDPQKKKKKMPEGMVQKKEENTAPPDLAAELEAQSGKGSPLPAETLAEMNRSFGMDFSAVRVHHDAAAIRLCCELNAQAFTHGHDIYFNEGKYNPASAEGKHLLAHELTHFAQQNS